MNPSPIRELRCDPPNHSEAQLLFFPLSGDSFVPSCLRSKNDFNVYDDYLLREVSPCLRANGL